MKPTLINRSLRDFWAYPVVYCGFHVFEPAVVERPILRVDVPQRAWNLFHKSINLTTCYNQSQEVLWNDALLVLPILGCGLEYLVVLLAGFVELQDRRNIPTAIAVVGRRPNSHQLIVKYFLIPFHHQLVGSANQTHVVQSVELLSGLVPE